MEQMKFLYTSRAVFDKAHQQDGRSWESYIEWSKLKHLTEVVSLDLILSENLVEPDYKNADDWNFIHTDGKYITGLYTTPVYVLRASTTNNRFNFLAVVINPTRDCKNVHLIDYEFVGYELLDKDYGTSVLTNCGGLIEAPLPTDLNKFGLISDYGQSLDTQKRLFENNPQVHHADTNLIAVWRHKLIGRQ